MPSPKSELGMILSDSLSSETLPLFSEAPFAPPIRARSGRSVTFNHDIKKQVFQQQQERCAVCGVHCRGHEAKEHEMKRPLMQIHHDIPLAHGGDNSRTNAVGLCADNCHPEFDARFHETGVTVFQYLKAQGRPYAPLRGHKR